MGINTPWPGAVALEPQRKFLQTSLPSWSSFGGAVPVLRGLTVAVAGAGATIYFACLATARPSLPSPCCIADNK